LPLTSATRPEISALCVGIAEALSSSCCPRESTALCTASPRMVAPKFELLMSNAPPPPPPEPAPAPTRVVPPRDDSPLPSATARISAVLVSIIRAVTATTAFELRLCTPPSPILPSPKPPPPAVVFLSSRPNCVMLPMMIISTPRTFPIFAAVDESARLLFEKFCSPSTFSSAARSITEYLPSLTSFMTSKSEMPLPTS